MLNLNEKRIFRVVLFLTLLTLSALVGIDTFLKNDVTPQGIISYEFCAYNNTCESALSEWGVKGKQLAMLSLGLDYLFMVLYPLFLVLCLLRSVPSIPERLMPLNAFMMKASVASGVADAIENFALIQIVQSESTGNYGWLGSGAATLKFVLLIAVIGWLVFAFF